MHVYTFAEKYRNTTLNYKMDWTMLVCFIAYSLSAVWVLLFPLLSISTAELKPRGLYVDENALVVEAMRSANDQNKGRERSHEWVKHDISSIDDLCVSLMGEGASSCKTTTVAITEIIIDAPSKVLSAEVTLIALPFISCNNLVKDRVMQTAYDMSMSLLRSMWLSKRVIILLVPTSCGKQLCDVDMEDMQDFDFHLSNHDTEDMCETKTGAVRHSKVLSQWLAQYHGTNDSGAETPEESCTNHSVPDATYVGVIRDAYVLDLSQTLLSPQLSKKGEEKALKAGTTEAVRAASMMDVRIIGTNGVLPNMDLVSSTLALFPSALRLAYHAPASGARYPNTGTVGMHRDRGNWDRGDKATFISYWEKLQGLVVFWLSQMQGPDGLHSQFLGFNIDSLSLIPHNQIEMGAAEAEYTETSGAHMLHLDILLLLVRCSSNLHEELHHSHFFYLIQSPSSFVGLSEYAPTMLLVLLPLLAMYFDMSKRCTQQSLAQVLPLLVLDFSVPLVVMGIGFALKKTHKELGHDSKAQIGMFLSYGASLFLYMIKKVRGQGLNRDILRRSYFFILSAVLIAGLAWLGAHFYALAFPIAFCVFPILLMCMHGGAVGKSYGVVARVLSLAVLLLNPFVLSVVISDISSKGERGLVIAGPVQDWFTTQALFFPCCFLVSHVLCVTCVRCINSL